MDDYSKYVPDVHYELIPIKNLVSNQDYQRNLSVKHVQKAANEFDLCQINPVKVSRRDCHAANYSSCLLQFYRKLNSYIYFYIYYSVPCMTARFFRY